MTCQLWSRHTLPNERLLQHITAYLQGCQPCRHTLPNERLLQLTRLGAATRLTSRHTLPNERLLQLIGGQERCWKQWVVIPFQTKGFYNSDRCHYAIRRGVVIPFQTKGFYNGDWQKCDISASRHTLPNERLLQHDIATYTTTYTVSSYPSKRKASTTSWSLNGANVTKSSYPSKRKASTTVATPPTPTALQVVIPFQTKGFYNCHDWHGCDIHEVVIPFQTKGFYNLSLLAVLSVQTKSSYPSKRKASTTGL